MATAPEHRARDVRRTLLASLCLGVGLMAAIDEIVFHQILAWHHFFDWSTPAFALLSDGLLHAGELLLLGLGFVMLLELRGRNALAGSWARAGLVLGLGGFQLFDGIVDHKILRLHQIREADPLWPYDLAWNGAALLLIGLGLSLLKRARRDHPLRRGA